MTTYKVIVISACVTSVINLGTWLVKRRISRRDTAVDRAAERLALAAAPVQKAAAGWHATMLDLAGSHSPISPTAISEDRRALIQAGPGFRAQLENHPLREDIARSLDWLADGPSRTQHQQAHDELRKLLRLLADL